MHVIKSFRGEHSFLSNFYNAPFRWNVGGLLGDPGLRFPTVEHAFQACKYKVMVDVEYPVDRLNYVHSVLTAKTPQDAKALGQPNNVKIDVDEWEAIKVDCMRKAVFEKFLQHRDLRDSLLGTGHALLVEGNTWNDTFWGRCNGKGYNILGAILMEVRGFWKFQRPDLMTHVECTYPCVCT